MSTFRNISFYGYLKNITEIKVALDSRYVGFLVDIVEDENGEPSIVIKHKGPFAVHYRIGYAMDSWEIAKPSNRFRFDKNSNRIVFPEGAFTTNFRGLFQGEIADHVVTLVGDDFMDFLDACEDEKKHACDLWDATLVERVAEAEGKVVAARAALAEAKERLKGAQGDLDVAKDMLKYHRNPN
jgi:hypothetical protein